MVPGFEKPILCIDLGGLRIKGMLIQDSKITAEASRDVSYMDEGLIDGGNYLRKTRDIVRELSSKAASKELCLALTSQRASIVGWDKDLNTITPIYTWRHRSGGQVLNKVLEKYELGPLALFLQPGSGILRVKYILDTYGGIDFIGGLESLVIYSMFSTCITSYSLAYPYGALDPFELNWIDELLGILGVPGDKLPELVGERVFDISTYSNGVKIILASLVADQSASLIGCGCLSSNHGKISLGTGCFIDIFTGESFIGDPTYGVNPMLIMVYDGRPLYMAEYFIYHWGDILDWLKHMYPNIMDAYYYDVSKIPPTIPTPDYLTTEFKHIVGGIDVYGLATHHEFSDIVAGIIHALIYLVRRGVGILNNLSSISRLYLDGGWSMDAELAQLLSSSLGIEVYLRRYRYGATMVGSSALAISRDMEELKDYIEAINPLEARIRPYTIKSYEEYVSNMDKLLEKLTQSST